MKDWNYFNRYREINHKYLPNIGEGDTLATQIVTAVNKLVYKWYNDGDVYDNTYTLEGWANDLSSYANWLARYAGVNDILVQISDITNAGEYEDLLAELCDSLLDCELLAVLAKRPSVGSIYKCDGPFRFDDYYDEDEDEYY